MRPDLRLIALGDRIARRWWWVPGARKVQRELEDIALVVAYMSLDLSKAMECLDGVVEEERMAEIVAYDRQCFVKCTGVSNA